MNLNIKVLADNKSHWTNHPTYENAKKNEDSGLDIPMPSSIVIPGNSIGFTVDLGYKAEQNFGYMLIPRSSLGKTPIRLSNSIGIIDKNYRGKVKVKVDNLEEDRSFELLEGNCYFQIIAFDGILPKMTLTNKVSVTKRNNGGFGSTTNN